MNKSSYRRDIDGMRAMAVLGVIFYHAFPRKLCGGFIGVDIFFVISGYLISDILFQKVGDNSFSFSEFYARRIRRLFPALLVLLILCLLYGFFVLLQDEYQQLGKHVAAGGLFIQNIVFWRESGYFDISANLKPLLHLWSLAVEEQFYILFPPLVILIWKRKWRMFTILCALLLLSLAANLLFAAQDREADFFLTCFRTWEFLAGAILAWLNLKKSARGGGFLLNSLSFSGILLLLAGMMMIHGGTPYPGWRAIIPVAGSIMIIGAGGDSWVNRYLLSHPVMVWFGLISYPLYLFHWPALSFTHIITGDLPGRSPIFLALGVALFLSVATYYLIERPLRYSGSKIIVPMLSVLFIMIALLGLLVWKGGITHSKDHHYVTLKKTIERAIQDREWDSGTMLLWQKQRISLKGAGGQGSQTLFFGDSNMMQYGPRIVELLSHPTKDSRGSLLLTCVGVPPIPGISNPLRPECAAFVSEMEKLVSSDRKIDRIVIAALWPWYFFEDSKFCCHGISLGTQAGRDAAIGEFGRMIAKMVTEGKTVSVVLSIPWNTHWKERWSFFDPRTSCTRGISGRFNKNTRTFTVQEYMSQNGSLMSQIATTARENGAEVIDPLPYLSRDGICISDDNDGPIHYDYGHLRATFVRDHVRYLDGTLTP